MSSNPQAVFIKVANTLKRRAARGKGMSVDQLQEVAARVMTDHAATLREAMLGSIAESRDIIARWKAGGDHAALAGKLAAMATQAEDQGTVFGNPLLHEVGKRLASFVALFAKSGSAANPSAKAIIALELHLDAMLVAIEQGQHDTIADSGQTLLRNLELTQRTIG